MESKQYAEDLVRRLSAKCRIVTLGGVAVISHGLSRNTHDLDIWLDPLESPELWSRGLWSELLGTPQVVIVEIVSHRPVKEEELPEIIEQHGVVRLNGMDRPLDIFRRPNEMETSDFEAVWERATPLADGTRLPDVVDLLITKLDTGRAKDLYDIQFLEGKAEELYLARLPRTDVHEALAMLDRFLNPNVAAAAAVHSAGEVRDAGMKFLQELAKEGDPFATELLTNLGVK